MTASYVSPLGFSAACTALSTRSDQPFRTRWLETTAADSTVGMPCRSRLLPTVSSRRYNCSLPAVQVWRGSASRCPSLRSTTSHRGNRQPLGQHGGLLANREGKWRSLSRRGIDRSPIQPAVSQSVSCLGVCEGGARPGQAPTGLQGLMEIELDLVSRPDGFRAAARPFAGPLTSQPRTLHPVYHAIDHDDSRGDERDSEPRSLDGHQ